MPFIPPGDLPGPGIEPTTLSLVSPALADEFFTTSTTWEAQLQYFVYTYILLLFYLNLIFPGGSEGKESACNTGDPGSIPGSGRCPGEGNGNPL